MSVDGRTSKERIAALERELLDNGARPWCNACRTATGALKPPTGHHFGRPAPCDRCKNTGYEPRESERGGNPKT